VPIFSAGELPSKEVSILSAAISGLLSVKLIKRNIQRRKTNISPDAGAN
jgi:hypothetical protein